MKAVKYYIKVLLLLISLFCISPQWGFSQIQKGEFELEVVPLKISLNTGIYRSRLDLYPGPQGGFNQPGMFIQVYFPFQRSFDHPENFKRKRNDSTYYDRLFSVRPLALFHITDKGGNGLALGQELCFKLKRRLFFKSQLAIIWVEASNKVDDGLVRGLNFHHYWHFSYFLNKKLALSIGLNHISNGRILASTLGANYDMLTTGLSFSIK